MPQNLSATRMDAARAHYPSDFKFTERIPYRQIIFADSQVYWRFIDWLFPKYFDYKITATFTRLHCNPPIWHDYHPHDFTVSVTMTSPCRRGDLYGVDMVEVEQILHNTIASIPEKINNLPCCHNGTTEQLCQYFVKTLKFSDRAIKIKSVSISETPNRITKLCLKA